MENTERREIIDGRAIRRARLRLGLTQRGLSEKCLGLGLKLDASNIHKAERHNNGIGPRKLPTLALALECPVDELLTISLREPSGKAA